MGAQEFIEITDALRDEGNFVNLNNDINLQIAFGLEKVETEIRVGSQDTTIFGFSQSTDFEGNNFFHGQAELFPWGISQPNNFGGSQNCAFLIFIINDEFIANGLLNDLSCNEPLNGAICRSECFLSEFDIPFFNSSNFRRVVLENESSGSVTVNQASDRCSLKSDEFGNDLTFEQNFTLEDQNLVDDILVEFLMKFDFTDDTLSTSLALGRRGNLCFQLLFSAIDVVIRETSCNSLLDGYICTGLGLDIINDENDDDEGTLLIEKKINIYLFVAAVFGAFFVLTLIILLERKINLIKATKLQQQLIESLN